MKLITLGMLMFCSAALFGQSDTTPPVVTNGLAAYQKAGGKEAMAVWLKGSSVENDTTTRINMAGMLAQFETAYGKMIGSEQIRIVAVTHSFRRVYVLIKFEKGPVFASFDCYQAEKDWIVAQIEFNTKANVILPQSILTEER